MSRKISSVGIRFTSALRTAVRVNKGAFTAAANLSSPIDHVNFIEGAVYRAVIRFADAVSLILDNASITLTKSVNDFVTATDDLTFISSDKGVNDFVISSDTFVALINFNLSITDYNSIDDRYSSQFTKILNDTVNSPIDSISLNPTKGLNDVLYAIEDLTRTVDFNRTLEDVTLALETLNRTVDYVRAYEDFNGLEDFASVQSVKSLADTVDSLSDSNTTQFIKAILDESNILDSIFVTSTFNRTLQDSTPADEIITLNVSKTLDESFSLLDQTLLNYVKSLSDTVDLLVDAIQSKSINKKLSDFVQALDLLQIFDGSEYSINKQLSDSLSTSDFISIINGSVLNFTDSVFTSGDLLALILNKNIQEDLHSIDFKFYTLDKSLADSTENFSETYKYSISKVLFEQPDPVLDSIALNFSRPLPNETLSTSDFSVRGVFKAFSEIAETSDTLLASDGTTSRIVKSLSNISSISDIFSRTVSFIRSFSETEKILEGPSYGDESGYATGYFAPDDGVMYTEEFRPVWALAKVLNDTQPVTEKIFNAISKPISNDSAVSTDKLTTQSIKLLYSITSTSDLLSSSTTFLRSFTDNSLVLPGPVPFNEENYSEQYFDPDYIKDYRVLFNFIKSLQNVTTLNDFAKIVTNKVISTFSTLADDNSFVLQKILSSFATPEDLLGIFDGSTYSFNKTTSSTAATADDDTVQFTAGKSDQVLGATSNGKLISSDYFVDLTYFTLLDDYIGQSRSFIPIEDLVTLSGSEDLMTSFGSEDLIV